MSTTRPYSPGDRGPEPSGASGAAARGRAAGRQVRSLSFDGASGVVPLARDFARQALYAWGWLPAATADQRAAAEDVLLVVSELVTNACLHAEGPDGALDRLRQQGDPRRGLRPGHGPAAPRTPHRAGPPRRPRHVHRAAALPGLGVVRTPGSRARRCGRSWARRPRSGVPRPPPRSGAPGPARRGNRPA